MKRFLLFTILLALTLLVARVADARASDRDRDSEDQGSVHWHGHAEWDFGDDRGELLSFFDHDVETSPSVVRSARTLRVRNENQPRVRGDRLRLRYKDRGYDRVLLESDDEGWEARAMRLSEEGTRWEIEIPLPERELRYRFVVQYDDGRERDRVDPSHSGRVRDDDMGWVSELRFDRRGDLVWPRADREDEDRRHRRRRADYDLDLFRHIGVDYQRVDGWLLSTRPRFESWSRWSPTLSGLLGYGLKSDRWSAGLWLLQPLTPAGELRAVLAAYDRTDFTDRTGVTGEENLLSTLLFREDNREHFRREGASIGLEGAWSDRLLGRLEFHFDEYESLDRIVRAGWWGREDFLPNRPVDEGRMRSLYLKARLGQPLQYFQVEYELSDESFSSDFDFQQLELSFRTRLRMGYSQYLDLRAQWGTNLSGELPLQKRYLVGGIGTIRGYNYQSVLLGSPTDPQRYGGEQMFLATAEYVLGVEDAIQLALFADTGMAYVDRRAGLDPKDFVSSAGVGVLFGGSDGIRLDVIRTLDEGGDDFVLQGRLRRAF